MDLRLHHPTFEKYGPCKSKPYILPKVYLHQTIQCDRGGKKRLKLFLIAGRVVYEQSWKVSPHTNPLESHLSDVGVLENSSTSTAMRKMLPISV